MPDPVLTLSRDALSVNLTAAITTSYPGSGTGLFLGPAPSLFGAPPVLVDEVARVSLAGSVLTVRSHKARDIVIPILMRVENDGGDLEEVLEDLALLVDPIQSATKVRLTFTRADGTTVRWIDGVCTAGASGLSVRYKGARHTRATLLFRCPDPYWHSGTANSETVNAAATTAEAWDAAVAYDLNKPYDQALHRQDTTSPTGDLPVRPVWEIDGPATRVVLHNETTDESLQWVGTLADGSTMTINTKLGEQAVTIGGVSAWSGLDSRSTLWTFTPGSNRPYASNIAGSGANTAVRLLWLPAFLSC